MVARFDMVRRVQRFVAHSTGKSFVSVALPSLLGLGQDPALAARYYALADYHRQLVAALFRHFYDHDSPSPAS